MFFQNIEKFLTTVALQHLHDCHDDHPFPVEADLSPVDPVVQLAPVVQSASVAVLSPVVLWRGPWTRMFMCWRKCILGTALHTISHVKTEHVCFSVSQCEPQIWSISSLCWTEPARCLCTWRTHVCGALCAEADAWQSVALQQLFHLMSTAAFWSSSSVKARSKYASKSSVCLRSCPSNSRSWIAFVSVSVHASSALRCTQLVMWKQNTFVFLYRSVHPKCDRFPAAVSSDVHGWLLVFFVAGATQWQSHLPKISSSKLPVCHLSALSPMRIWVQFILRYTTTTTTTV